MRSRHWLSLGTVVWLALASVPADAHHVMGGKLPTTFMQGALSGLAHPIIGIDHLAAVLAVGCLAALYRLGPALAIGFILAVMAGVIVHLQQTTVPGSEILVALSVMALGATLILRTTLAPGAALALFVLAGMLHGYALGESIVGAEPAPLYAYFVGLAVVQTAVALAALALVRGLARAPEGALAPVRLVGAGILGVGLATLAAQIGSGA